MLQRIFFAQDSRQYGTMRRSIPRNPAEFHRRPDLNCWTKQINKCLAEGSQWVQMMICREKKPISCLFVRGVSFVLTWFFSKVSFSEFSDSGLRWFAWPLYMLGRKNWYRDGEKQKAMIHIETHVFRWNDSPNEMRFGVVRALRKGISLSVVTVLGAVTKDYLSQWDACSSVSWISEWHGFRCCRCSTKRNMSRYHCCWKTLCDVAVASFSSFFSLQLFSFCLPLNRMAMTIALI